MQGLHLLTMIIVGKIYHKHCLTDRSAKLNNLSVFDQAFVAQINVNSHNNGEALMLRVISLGDDRSSFCRKLKFTWAMLAHSKANSPRRAYILHTRIARAALNHSDHLVQSQLSSVPLILPL